VLQVIADFTGLNIIASDTVSGNITLRLKDVPWDQALDIILRAKGLDKRVTGNVIWVAPRDELAAKEKLELEAKQLITETIPLNYLRANEAHAILEGRSVAALQAGEAVSCEASGGIGGAQQAAAAATGQATAQRVLSKRGSAAFDLKTNTLFVQDTAAKIKEIKEVLAKVDVPSRQVMIEARIVVAEDTFSRNLGARLGYQFG
ncbi:MAG: secretin and TonB N-terminal domain-containing protein, partial [Burkholderiales bacterium]|nr:secretin and TonB N-terminal domain-containing protein [Burkholderiales bacterium]